MKILILQGGARKKGHTAKLLGWIEQEFESLDHDVDNITLHDKNIKACLACAKCKEVANEIGCIQKDDAIEILEKMAKADLVLFSSPLYFWGLAGPLKTFIDRTYSLYINYHQPGHSSLVADQRQALLVTGGGPYENNAEPVFTAFARLQKPHIAVNAGELYIGGCKDPDNLDEQSREKAISFARTITSQSV